MLHCLDKLDDLKKLRLNKDQRQISNLDSNLIYWFETFLKPVETLIVTDFVRKLLTNLECTYQILILNSMS